MLLLKDFWFGDSVLMPQHRLKLVASWSVTATKNRLTLQVLKSCFCWVMSLWTAPFYPCAQVHGTGSGLKPWRSFAGQGREWHLRRPVWELMPVPLWIWIVGFFILLKSTYCVLFISTYEGLIAIRHVGGIPVAGKKRKWNRVLMTTNDLPKPCQKEQVSCCHSSTL